MKLMSSLKITRASAIVLLGVSLAACHGKSDPSPENFVKAVQKHLDTVDAVCVDSGPLPFDLPHYNGYVGYQEGQADALVRVGLLSKEPTSVNQNGRAIPGFHYSATDEGKKASRPNNRMCDGKTQIQSITWSSSVPDNAPVGTTVQVKYVAKLVERPHWDDEATLRKTHVEVLSTNDGTYNAENFLELTSDGWAVKQAWGTP
ncbi:hypothetical protein [Paraburkholderia hospita]|nr:hypothetical protein [Paraburkholderia hospita]